MNIDMRPGVEAVPDPAAGATAIPVAVRLWQAVAAAHAALAVALEADGGACPVLAADAFAVLLSLADEPGQQLRMHELAGRSHLTPSGLTRRVDRLESDGLVDRVGCPGDRRGAFAQLTPRGLDELQRALPHHAAVLERHVAAHLDDSEADALIALLRGLSASPRLPVERGRVVDPPTPETTDRGR
jgi:DNA-binding MarR family transcriptional regulator